MKSGFAFLFLILIGLPAVADEISPKKDFNGIDDQGAKVTCQFVGVDAIKRSQFDCQFPPEVKTIAAIGNQTLEKTWCDVVGGKVDLFDCHAGLADFAHFFVRTDAATTGLIACRMATIPIQPRPLAKCAVHHNPAAGVFGTAQGRKNLAKCTDPQGNEMLVDQLTEKAGNFQAGDYVFNRYNPDTRVTLTDGKLTRNEKEGWVEFRSQGAPDKTETILIPGGDLPRGEIFLARIKKGKDNFYTRARCEKGEAL